MTPKIFRFAVLSLFAATQLPSFAATQAITCPTSIKPASIQVNVSESPEWTPYVGAALYLHAAAPMSGPPQMRGDLADFTTRPGKLEWSYTYKLEGNFDTGKWIQCAYGANNEITLSRRISDKAQKCTITYRKGKKVAQHEIKIECD